MTTPRADRPWQKFGIALAVTPIVVVVASLTTRPEHGFAFTPRWSAVFAFWLLLVLTLVFDWVIRHNNGTAQELSVKSEMAVANTERSVAIKRAEEARKEGVDPVNDESAREAGKLAINAEFAASAAIVLTRRQGLKSLLVGQDGRASTSKIQAALWTYAILFTFIYVMAIGKAPIRGSETPQLVAFKNALGQLLSKGIELEYIVMLGLPVGAALAAKAITSGKVANKELLKPPAKKMGVASGLAESVSTDNGHADLLDFQYLAFNLITLAYFFITFANEGARNPSEGLPVIPPTLLVLSGVSTSLYVAKKQLETGLAPTITSVTPMKVILGVDKQMLINGSGFLGENRHQGPMNQVLLDGRPLVPIGPWNNTSVTVSLPAGDAEELRQLGWTDRNDAQLTVQDDQGRNSQPVTVEIGFATSEHSMGSNVTASRATTSRRSSAAKISTSGDAGVRLPSNNSRSRRSGSTSRGAGAS
jgi:hypothetical protein